MSSAHSRAGEFRKAGENLYRYSSNGIYYAIFRDKGKLKWRSLKTTDRAMAKRRLTEAIEKARRIDPAASRMSLSKLLEVYEAQIKGLKTKTCETRQSILKTFKATWTHGLEIQVRDVNKAHLQGWIAQHRQRLKKSSLNEYLRFLRQLFEVALDSRVISDSPAVTLKGEKPETPIRISPNWKQFHAIVMDIRSQRHNPDAENTADLVEFMGQAGIGTAEAGNLEGQHINFETNQITLYRVTSIRPLVPQHQLVGWI
jgi:site-specific recombinase XerD